MTTDPTTDDLRADADHLHEWTAYGSGPIIEHLRWAADEITQLREQNNMLFHKVVALQNMFYRRSARKV